MMLNWLFSDHYLITDWATAMVRAIWQGSIVFALVWLIFLIFPKIHPGFRCWLWRLAYLKLLISLFGIPVFQVNSISPLEAPLASGGVTYLKSNPVLQWMATQPSILNLVSPNFSVFSIPRLWFIVWVIGITGFGVYLMVLWRRNRNTRLGCYPVQETFPESSLKHLYTELCVGVKIKRAPRLFISNSLESPSLQGLIHPIIILPASFLTQYSLEELKLMLAHELAHFKRGDLFWNWLPIIARWLFFFHPLVWLAERELKQLHEIGSDHLALQLTGTPNAEYGKVLLKVTCRPANFQSRLNAGKQLAEYYTAETKQILKRRLVALNYPNRVPAKIIIISVLVLILFGIFSVIPWNFTLVGSPAIFISVNYSVYNNQTLTIVGGVLHSADKIAIKKYKVEVDGLPITPRECSANFFVSRRDNLTKTPFDLDSPHQIKLLIRTTGGTFQEKYAFNFTSWYFKNSALWMNRTF